MKGLVYALVHVSTALLASLLLRGLQICSAKARESEKYGLRFDTEGSNKTSQATTCVSETQEPYIHEQSS